MPEHRRLVLALLENVLISTIRARRGRSVKAKRGEGVDQDLQVHAAALKGHKYHTAVG